MGWMIDISTFVPAEYIPENPYNNYGVFLKDTAFGEYFSGISEMPEDTVLCFRRTSMLTDAWSSEEDKKKVEEYYKELFRRILAFQVPSEEGTNGTPDNGENSVPPEKT